MIHGGSHYLKLDKPLNYGSDRVLTKLTRVETVRQPQHALGRGDDRPAGPEPVRVRPRIVPANVNGRRDMPPCGAASVGGPAGSCLFVYRPKRFFRKAAWSALAAISTVLCVAPA